MSNDKQQAPISKTKSRWLWRWAEPESVLTVIPSSKTSLLAQKAQLANVDAENAFERAYQAELIRTKAIAEALFKSGKALRYSLSSSIRQVFLRTEAARRRFEPGYPEKI